MTKQKFGAMPATRRLDAVLFTGAVAILAVFTAGITASIAEDAETEHNALTSTTSSPETKEPSPRIKALQEQLSALRDENREREKCLFQNLTGVNVSCIATSATARKLLPLEPVVEKKLTTAGLRLISDDGSKKRIPPRLLIDARAKKVNGKRVIIANATLTEPVTLRREHKVTVFATTWQRHRMQELDDNSNPDEEIAKVVDKLAEQFVDQYKWSCEHSTKHAHKGSKSI